MIRINLLQGTSPARLDAQRPVVWNMGEIAASRHPHAAELFRKIILASAAIPGAFPPVNITVEVDGKTGPGSAGGKKDAFDTLRHNKVKGQN